jgi:hypothetical protein
MPRINALALIVLLSSAAAAAAVDITFPKGTATPSELCGVCHKAIYREFQYGFGADMKFGPMALKEERAGLLTLPATVSDTATAHAVAGVDPFPVHARDAEEAGRSCNVCHFPEAFLLPEKSAGETAKPKGREKGTEATGLTCASCHLTPEGIVRGPFEVNGPHRTVADPQMMTSQACAFCHSLGKRIVGKQTQTFLEWREDFYKVGLGNHQCQDCHMPRTLRKVAEDYDFPMRPVARHLWTGGRSKQRLQSALSLTAVQPVQEKPGFEFHVINIGAGHSVPTGSNRRAIYLVAEAVDSRGAKVAGKEWMFAPWYGNRPDDRKFLDEDKARPDAVAAAQADAQGPHETTIRAGEERVLAWAPELPEGSYTLKATLVYDLNRYNDRSFTGDHTEMAATALPVIVKK